MGWLDLFKGRTPASSTDRLREALFDAVEADDGTLDRMCRDDADRILAEFQGWQKPPKGVRDDPEAVARYGRGLLAVAAWFARNGTPRLLEALDGGGANPIRRWERAFGEADALKARGRFAEAIVVLEGLAEEVGTHRGTAVERYLPMIQGSLGECYFRHGEHGRAYDATRAALNGCQRSGDLEGIVAYCGNLSEICGARGADEEAGYWRIVTTNVMIQTGQGRRAAEIRRAYGIEPAEGLIEAEGPLG